MKNQIEYSRHRIVAQAGPGRFQQQGVALLMALIALVAMTLASIALVRSVDTGTLIAGNLAFRQSATLSGDRGIEAARTWLMANSASLANDNAPMGYFATNQNGSDMTGNRTPDTSADDANWSGLTPITDVAGNSMVYIINRVCDNAGVLDAATCGTKQSTQGGGAISSTQSEMQGQGKHASITSTGYYRVTVRISGARNNTSYVQAILTI